MTTAPTTRQGEVDRRREYEADREPHLFIAKDPWDDVSLWFGAGPEDRHCELIQLGNYSDAARKALWEALVTSPFVDDAEAEVTA